MSHNVKKNIKIPDQQEENFIFVSFSFSSLTYSIQPFHIFFFLSMWMASNKIISFYFVRSIWKHCVITLLCVDECQSSLLLFFSQTLFLMIFLCRFYLLTPSHNGMLLKAFLLQRLLTFLLINAFDVSNLYQFGWWKPCQSLIIGYKIDAKWSTANLREIWT